MTPLLLWFLSVLASYRLAYLLTIDNGPGYIFLNWREIIKRKYGENSWQYEGASCAICQSVWYAFIFSVYLAYLLGAIELQPLLWLSIAGACVVLHWAVLALIALVRRIG
jgi:hypothetical protein